MKGQGSFFGDGALFAWIQARCAERGIDLARFDWDDVLDDLTERFPFDADADALVRTWRRRQLVGSLKHNGYWRMAMEGTPGNPAGAVTADTPIFGVDPSRLSYQEMILFENTQIAKLQDDIDAIRARVTRWVVANPSAGHSVDDIMTVLLSKLA